MDGQVNACTPPESGDPDVTGFGVCTYNFVFHMHHFFFTLLMQVIGAYLLRNIGTCYDRDNNSRIFYMFTALGKI